MKEDPESSLFLTASGFTYKPHRDHLFERKKKELLKKLYICLTTPIREKDQSLIAWMSDWTD